jgi:uncharacterized peroxidase-related enzyme
MSDARFRPLTSTTAPEAARGMLAATERKFGFLPTPVARAAHSPIALRHLLGGFGAFDQTSLTPLEREVIAMTVAFEHDCHYCMAMHSALLAGDPAAAPIVAALREGTSIPVDRLEALRLFARTLVRERGHVPEHQWATLDAVGFTEAQALDVVLGVGVYVLSTFVNIMTGAALDPPFAAFAWQHPARRVAASVA